MPIGRDGFSFTSISSPVSRHASSSSSFQGVIAEGFKAALQDRLADAQIVDAGRQRAVEQQRQGRRIAAGNIIEADAGQTLDLVGMGDQLPEILLASA